MSSGQVKASLLTRDGLTPKQEAFCCFFVILRNATLAAERAGYEGNNDTLRNTGSDNLALPCIKARISQLISQQITPEIAIASVSERKSRLTEILRSKIETPIRPDHVIQASDQLNKMDRLYSEAALVNNDNRVVNIYVKDNETKEAINLLRSLPEPSPGALSTSDEVPQKPKEVS